MWLQQGTKSVRHTLSPPHGPSGPSRTCRLSSTYAVAAAVAALLTAVITVALEPLVPSCAAPRLPVAEPVYSADAVYDQVRESTVLAVENAKHAVGMA